MVILFIVGAPIMSLLAVAFVFCRWPRNWEGDPPRGLRPPLARIFCPLMAFAVWAAHTTHCARAALQALPSPFPDFASAKFCGPQDAGRQFSSLRGHDRDSPRRPRLWTPLYDRPFKCKAWWQPVSSTLFAVESHAELEEIQCAIAGPPQPARAPSTHPPPDPDRGLL